MFLEFIIVKGIYKDEKTENNVTLPKVSVPTVQCDRFRLENLFNAKEISHKLDIGRTQF